MVSNVWGCLFSICNIMGNMAGREELNSLNFLAGDVLTQKLLTKTDLPRWESKCP
jgi:hypothetical protein